MKSSPRIAPFSRLVPLSLALLGFVIDPWASEWPQYRGANHDGVSTDAILREWPASGPREVWRKAVTDGFSSFAVSQGRAFTQVRRTIDGSSREVCIALDSDTGNELWATSVGTAKYDSGGDDGAAGNGGGDGPRSTPTVDENRVFVSTSTLSLFCLNATNGAVIWQSDLRQNYQGVNISWQNAASPLIDGERLFVNCNAGAGSLLALNKADGSLAWRSQTDKLTHSTPVAATILGVRQIIFMTQTGLVSVAPDSGTVLWRYPFKYSTATSASPVVADDIVYCSAPYGIGAGAVRISLTGTNLTANELWPRSSRLINEWSTPVYYRGYLYGLYGQSQYGYAPLKCVEVATGTEQWSESGFGPGGVLLVDGQILVLSDVGDLVLVQPDPTAYQEVARYHALEGKCWNSPAVANGRIYARSTTEAVCLDLSAVPASPLRVSSVRWINGQFECFLGCLDGSALDPGRLSRIRVQLSSELELPLSEWTLWSSPLLFTNGVVRLLDTEGNANRRFFFISETR